MDSAVKKLLELQRWINTSIALHYELTPPIRELIRIKMRKYHLDMVKNVGINSQTFEKHLEKIKYKDEEEELVLNYKSINGNAYYSDPSGFDYKVRNEVDFAKLFMEPYMAKFGAFDGAFEASAVLAVLSGAAVFPKTVRTVARDLKFKVRIPCSHPNFPEWTERHYMNCFQIMNGLVKLLKFPSKDEQRIVGGLQLWQTQGTLWQTINKIVFKQVYVCVCVLTHTYLWGPPYGCTPALWGPSTLWGPNLGPHNNIVSKW